MGFLGKINSFLVKLKLLISEPINNLTQSRLKFQINWKLYIQKCICLCLGGLFQLITDKVFSVHSAVNWSTIAVQRLSSYVRKTTIFFRLWIITISLRKLVLAILYKILMGSKTPLGLPFLISYVSWNNAEQVMYGLLTLLWTS